LSGLRMWFVAQNKRCGCLSLRWLWTTNLSTRTKSWMGDLSSQVRSCLPCCFVTACSTGLHLPNVLVHSFACIIAPSTWWFHFESLPCSLASHASMIFLQNKALAAPHACLLHVVWWKMLEGHPMMHHGACMVRLTRLPPSKHVLMLSSPLISKIKNKIRAIKYKFRGVF
jgi:hypothetical protein